MTAPQVPETYSPDYAELVRAKRLYTGLSKVGMAIQLGMSIRSYQRIEDGQDDCPPGLINSIDVVLDRFDTEVGECTDRAKTMLDGPGSVRIEVSGEPKNEWTRAVLGRAAVESGLVLPVLVDRENTARSA